MHNIFIVGAVTHDEGVEEFPRCSRIIGTRLVKDCTLIMRDTHK